MLMTDLRFANVWVLPLSAGSESLFAQVWANHSRVIEELPLLHRLRRLCLGRRGGSDLRSFPAGSAPRHGRALEFPGLARGPQAQVRKSAFGPSIRGDLRRIRRDEMLRSRGLEWNGCTTSQDRRAPGKVVCERIGAAGCKSVKWRRTQAFLCCPVRAGPLCKYASRILCRDTTRTESDGNDERTTTTRSPTRRVATPHGPSPMETLEQLPSLQYANQSVATPHGPNPMETTLWKPEL